MSRFKSWNDTFQPREFLLLGEFIVSGAYRDRSFKDYRHDAGKGS